MPKIQLIKVGHKTARQKFGQPLGIMYLAGYLRKFLPELQIQLLDMLPEKFTIESLAEKISEFKPDILGISAMSFEANEMHQLAKEAKKIFPQMPVVAGGPYITTASAKAFSDQNIDFIVRGEGEQTLLELVNYVFYRKGNLNQILGLGFRQNGETKINPDRPYFQNLDALPFPAWDLIRIEKYFELPRFGTTYVHKEYMQVMTSRGCPFHCTYCHRIFGVGFRPRTPENVLAELEILQKKFGIKEIYFVDDCFNCKPARAKRICELIVERGLKFSINFPNGIRGDVIDQELLDKMKSAGTYRITFAVETASERIQKLIKKNLNLEKVKKAIEMTDKMGILVDGFFMIGFPGEKKSEIEQTLNFALKSRLHSLNIFFVTPFEGTELYRQAQEMGYNLEIPTEASTYFYPKNDQLAEIPAKELNRLAQKIFIKFYLNPWRLWRILRLFPNKLQLPRLLWLFLKYSLKWN